MGRKRRRSKCLPKNSCLQN